MAYPTPLPSSWAQAAVPHPVWPRVASWTCAGLCLDGVICGHAPQPIGAAAGVLVKPGPAAAPGLDHPIFTESIRRIRLALQQPESPQAWRAVLQRCGPIEQDVLERCIHSSGDLSIAADLIFGPSAGPSSQPGDADDLGELGDRAPAACAQGLAALRAGALILTDTAMAAAAVAPMAARTFGNPVRCLLEWAPATMTASTAGTTRSALGLELAWSHLAAAPGPAPPVVLIGSAPTALERLLDLVVAGGAAPAPSLVIGMPVGFVGVAESKRRLAASGLAHIGLAGSRGGAGLVAAACNALLRRAWLQAASGPGLSAP